jgi:hypothetical protein
MNHSQRRKQLSQPTHTSLRNPEIYNLQLELFLELSMLGASRT